MKIFLILPTQLFRDIKNLNGYYNSLINYYFENNMTDIDKLIDSLNITDNNIILKIIDSYAHDIPTDIFKETTLMINELVKNLVYFFLI